MRKYNGKQPVKSSSVDAFMNYFYWNLAETLAETPSMESLDGAALTMSGIFLPGGLVVDLQGWLIVLCCSETISFAASTKCLISLLPLCQLASGR
ncbi:unnamed protein product [Effrenium voratum]|nr:unnamed protein product [Effrenium voratum]